MHTIEALWSLSGTQTQFFFTEQTDDRHTTDGHNRLLNPALRMCALGKNVVQ